MKNKFRLGIYISALAIAGTLVPAESPAGSYSAICEDGGECNVILVNGKINIPGLSIDSDDVISWSQGGKGSQTDIGMGIATTVTFGLLGIIGFGAKKHDYQFYINYLDDSGNGQMATIGFKNNTPAKQFTMEMMGMTGLSIGELNKSAQARLKRSSGNNNDESIQTESNSKASSNCAIVLRNYSCSWNKYLEANPGPRAWAEANPDLVPAEKARLNALD
jgi:hypothetical protein